MRDLQRVRRGGAVAGQRRRRHGLDDFARGVRLVLVKQLRGRLAKLRDHRLFRRSHDLQRVLRVTRQRDDTALCVYAPLRMSWQHAWAQHAAALQCMHGTALRPHCNACTALHCGRTGARCACSTWLQFRAVAVHELHCTATAQAAATRHCPGAARLSRHCCKHCCSRTSAAERLQSMRACGCGQRGLCWN